MKKLLSILLMVLFTSFASGQANPNLLSKIIFNPETAQEQHWNFNGDGILFEIKSSNETLLRDFIYDDSNNLLSTTNYIGATPGTITFTYDVNNHITQIGSGQIITYDAANNQYIIDPSFTNDDEYIDYTQYRLSSEGLLLEEKMYYVTAEAGNFTQSNFLCNYANGNLTAKLFDLNDQINLWDHVFVANPLKTGMLPILKSVGVFFNSVTSSYLDADYCSTQLPSELRYFSEDPESSRYLYELNVNNLPAKKWSKEYYFDDLETVILRANYYYQGDEIPD